MLPVIRQTMENMPANADARIAATRRSSRAGRVKRGLHHLEEDFVFVPLKRGPRKAAATQRTPRRKDLLLEGMSAPIRKSFAFRSTKRVDTPKSLQCAVPVNCQAIPNAITLGEFIELRNKAIGRIVGITLDEGGFVFSCQYFARTSDLPNYSFAAPGILDPAVVGLAELVQTNVHFSVTSYGRDIARLVFPFSERLALSNSFGGIYQRQSAFYWRHSLEYDAKLRPAGYLIDPSLPSDYRDFGPSGKTFPGETLSERILLNLREECHRTVQGMWVARKIDGKMVKTGWQLKTNEQHNFEQAELRRIVRQSSAGSKELSIRNYKRKMVMNITKPNMAAERRRYDTKTVVVTARGQTGLACVRGLFNGTVGTGRNEPWISTKDIGDRLINPSNVSKTSILTFAEVQSKEELASDVQTDSVGDDENDSRPRKRRKRNGLTMQFDPVQRRSCISIRGTTLPVGAAASEYKNYLRKFGLDPRLFADARLDERDVYRHPKLGCKVFGDERWTGGEDALWEVIDVDNTSDMAKLRLGNETRQVSLRYVEDNDINN